MVEDVRFDKVHSAAYSTRAGTIAARKMVDDVSEHTKKDRLKIINAAQESILTELNSKLIGRTQEILIEGIKDSKPFGRNRNDKIVFVTEQTPSDTINSGDVVHATIQQTSPWYLKGTVVQSK